MNKTLIEKFDSILLRDEDIIEKIDLEYCENQEKKLKETLEQLDKALKLFTSWHEKQKNTCYKLVLKDEKLDSIEYRNLSNGSYRYRESSVDKEFYEGGYITDDQDRYDIFKYYAGYDIILIRKLREKAIRFFISAIIGYFANKYSINTPYALNLSELNKWISFRYILKEIKSFLGGHLDFKRVAVQITIDNFRSEMKYHNFLIKGSTLEINRYLWNTKDELNVSDSKVQILIEAIHVFDNEQASSDNIFGKMSLKVGISHDVNSDNVKSVKFFKNNKLQIKFSDNITCKNFINRFDLDNNSS